MPPALERTALAAIARIDALNRATWRLVIWATAGMVLVGAYNALARYLDRSFEARLSSNGLVELQWYLFSLVFLLCAPWALRLGAHVRVDVLYGRLGPRKQAWIDLIGGLLFLLPFCGFALWSSWPAVRNAVATWENSPDPGGLYRWPILMVVPLAFALLLLQGLAEVLRRVLFLFADHDPHSLGLGDQHGRDPGTDQPADGGGEPGATR